MDFRMALMSSKMRTVIGAIIFVASIGIFFWGQPGAYNRVFAFFALVALITVFFIFCARTSVAINRRRGIYPQKGRETMDDVRRLALSGHKFFAIGIYRKVKNTGTNEATREVNRIIAEGK